MTKPLSSFLNTLLVVGFLFFNSGCSFFYDKIAQSLGLEPAVVESVSGYLAKGKKLGDYMETCQANGGNAETCAAPGLLLKKCIGDKEQDSCERFDQIVESGKPDPKLAEFTSHVKDSLVLKGTKEVLGLEAKPHFHKEPKGLFVQNVDKDSVWEKSGAKPGEVITEINGVPVNSAENMMKIVSELMDKPKDTVTIKSMPVKE